MVIICGIKLGNKSNPLAKVRARVIKLVLMTERKQVRGNHAAKVRIIFQSCKKMEKKESRNRLTAGFHLIIYNI